MPVQATNRANASRRVAGLRVSYRHRRAPLQTALWPAAPNRDSPAPSASCVGLLSAALLPLLYGKPTPSTPEIYSAREGDEQETRRALDSCLVRGEADPHPSSLPTREVPVPDSCIEVGRSIAMQLSILPCIVLAHGLGAISAAGPATSEYDEARALRVVRLAGAAYQPAEMVANWSCDPTYCVSGFTMGTMMTSSKLQLQGYIGQDSAESGNGLVISFRGTVDKDIKNWIADLDALFVSPYPDIGSASVERGFYNSYSFFQPLVHAYVAGLSPAPTRITVTGHSLGASIASLCAFDLARNRSVSGNATVDTITAGQPRTGNAAYASAFAQAIPTAWRLVHNRDIVPSVPTQFMGYHHTHTEIWYPETFRVGERNYTVCDGSGEDRKCSDGVFSDNPNDHTNYFNIHLGA